LLRKLRNAGSTRTRQGNGRRRSARTDDNVDSVNELILNQKGAPKSHRTTRKISREARIRQSGIRIVRQNLILKCSKKRRAQELAVANCALHRTRARKLLRRFPASAVDLSDFSLTKKISLWCQNDRVYVPSMTKETRIE